MGRPSLPTKSFNIAPDELESARYCAKEQGVSLNKYLRLAVLEKNRGVVQGLDTRDALDDIRATVRESETRNAMALESALADMRAEQSAALQANEDLVVKTLQAFSQFLAQQEPDAETLSKQPATKAASRGPVANPAFLPPKPY
ncbi:TPA: hypothetical protein UMY98_000038 [Stenotrophomonas maltophilia]|uniref:hypothetical protein n=1 Tax=Stenotrophomonas maltophilia TaxID=40324 RepID=UPI0013124006|nr:hypothetical protein [Stenotrophomonas maltophilia]MDG9766574.1 hypothetical protein [Stenotrophomonas maltophilia]HDS1326031.1 hypothetical protein [Stenotrophomonas maltophilia]HDS1348412.1 hypothetical protein [Stenotrophomonas maltophilia]HDS1352910.1 hypothetical protein [Stenotrophomonas maltophilia]HEL3840185.1 hypothetical protein [Stenotrophomonas maltophilia]